MRKISALVVTALVAVLGASTAPSMAASHNFLRFNSQSMVRYALCKPPQQLENVCVAWGQGQPGQLFGPCIKYQLQCESPTVVR